MKICTKCNQLKVLNNFPFRKDLNKYRNECKDCCNLRGKTYWKKLMINNPEKHRNRIQNYRKKCPWIKTFDNIKRRCNDSNHISYNRYGGRGIKCLITTRELKELWFRDKAYDMEQPSIDRIDNDGNYEISNCRYIELIDNKVHKTNAKPILQFDLNNNLIQEWDSVTEASEWLDMSIENIAGCARGEQKTAGKCVWRYKNAKS